MAGFSAALTVAAGIALAGAFVAAILVRPHEMEGPDEETSGIEAVEAAL
jgi:hypothetical protein